MAERPDPVAELDWDPSRARELGEGAVGRISHDAALARYLGELVSEHPDSS